jgi:CBS domain-containing protein
LGFTTTVTTIIVSSEYPGYTHNRILDNSRKIHRQKKKGKTHIHTIWNKRNVLGWRCDMTYDPIRITKDSDLAEAALIMMRNRISGIPVIDLDNELVGIITKTDIIRALADSYKDKFEA